MNRIEGLLDLVHDGVNQGTLALEEAHIALFNEPMVLLKNIPALEPTMQLVQTTQTEIISTVYKVVRTINEGAYAVLKELFHFADKYFDLHNTDSHPD